MTPAERARQIEREEFEAERIAVRERALAYAKQHRDREAEKLKAWMQSESSPVLMLGVRPESQRKGREKGNRAAAKNAKLHSAFGHKRTVSEWAAETGLSANTIDSRIHKGWTIERALTEPVMSNARRSVVYRNRHIIRRLIEGFNLNRSVQRSA